MYSYNLLDSYLQFVFGIVSVQCVLVFHSATVNVSVTDLWLAYIDLIQ